MAERKNTGLAVRDAIRLNDCFHELCEAIAARPAIKSDRDLWQCDYSALPGEPGGPERERWNHRCGSKDVALVALRNAVTNGSLQLWTYGPRGEAKIDRYELKEPTFRTFASGTYQPDMEQAIESARHQGARRLLLGVYAENTRAQEFYRRAGFSIQTSRRFRVGSEDYDDNVFAMTLT